MGKSLEITNPLVFTLDTAIYSLPAIMNAAYDYSEQATIEMEKISEKQVRVSLIHKANDSPSSATLVNTFRNLLVDHQVRIMVSQDCKVVRDIIVAQAFQPCENVEDVIELLKP